MKKKYNVITLCGSTKFKDEYIKAQQDLTLQGNIVISVGLFGHTDMPEIMDTETKEMLDDLHKAKIDMADEIFVINVGGYIGSSTKSEIEYAHLIGKKVSYLYKENNNENENNYNK
jgi:hypothetical protein